MLLGNQYAEVAHVVRWLAPLPAMQALHFFAADTLTGAGLQRVRSAIQVATVALNALLNLWLVPTHGWHGSAWASIASDATLALGLWGAVLVLSRAAPDPKRAAADQVPASTS
jgi:O-antigen/teichoic acid export membrane protein